MESSRGCRLARALYRTYALLIVGVLLLAAFAYVKLRVPEDQGIASSLINTTVNYSISLGLGIAGTIVRQLNSRSTDVLTGYRGAWYFGIGLDGVAVAIALYFVVKY